MRELLTLIEGAQWAKTKTLPAGTLLFHGTDDEDFHPSEIRGPAWFSTDHDVAGTFAHNRLLAYRLKSDLTLPMISNDADMEEFAERFNIDRSSSEDVRDSAKRSGISGWIIPDNYEPGDDILIVDLSVLEAITSDLADIRAEHLEEAVNAPDLELYHWTTAENLREIMRTGVLHGNTTHTLNGKEVEGVSLSRNPFFDISNTYAIGGIKAWRIGFNFQKLRYDHKIQPVRDDYLRAIPRQLSINSNPIIRKKVSSDEMEEFVAGDIFPLWRYVSSIAVEDRHIDVDFHPRETEEWDYEDFENGGGGMSQEDQELLFDILAGTYFGAEGMSRAFNDDRPLAIKLPVPFKVIDRDVHQVLDAKAVFGPRFARHSFNNDKTLPDEPEGKTPWPVGSSVPTRSERGQYFNNSTRTVVPEGVEHMTGTLPKVLEDNRAIAEYIGGLDERVDQEMVEEHFFGAHAALTLLPIESVKEGNPDGNMRSAAKEKRFAKMDLGTQPPIVVDNGVIADGHHRFRVAKAAGATDILAYVISYDGLNEEQLDERQTLPLNKGANDSARGLYAAFICVMKPNDFLRLTTDGDAHMDKIRNDEFSDLETYAKDGHQYYKKSNYNMPFLFIEYETGRVVGHEGRHRAAMVEKAGGRSFPCLIVFKHTEKWSLTYEKSSRTGHVDDETIQEFFPSENRAEDRADTLRSLNGLDEFDFFYEEFKIEQVSGKTTMKGSPRSQGWDYDAWKMEDFPEKFIGQYDRMVVIPTLRMKFGPVKGYNHFK